MARNSKGQERTERTTTVYSIPEQTVSTDRTMALRKVVVLFEYQGYSSLTVHGLVSGKLYFFERLGSIVEVDERDRNLLLAMPSLRQL